MKPSIVALSLIALAPLPALADPYVKLGGAFGTIDMSDIQNVYPSNADVSDSVSRAVVGVGARINANLGLEANYMSNSDNSVSYGTNKDSLSHDGFQVALYGYLPIARNVDLYGKLSANAIHTDYRTNAVTLPSGYYEETHNGTYLGFGGGFEFNLSQNATLRTGIEQIQLTNVVSSDALNGGSGDFNVTQGNIELLMYF